MALPILAAAARLAANAAKTQLAQSAKDSLGGFFNNEVGGVSPLVLKILVGVEVLGVLLMLAVSGSTAGNLTGVDNPRGAQECAPGEECVTVPVDCSGVASVPAEYLPWVKEAANKWLDGDEAKLIAVIQFESGWRKDAISGTGAVGLGQFIASTARTKSEFAGYPIYTVERANPPTVTEAEKEAFRRNHPDDGRLQPKPSIFATAELLHYALKNAGGDFRRAYAEGYNGEAGNRKYENADKVMAIYNALIEGGGCQQQEPTPPPETVGCVDVKEIPPPVPIKPTSGKLAQPTLADKLAQLYGRNQGWRVTEACPPTVPHQDPNHQNGRAVDIALYGVAVTEQVITELLADIAAVGFNDVLDEYHQSTEYKTGGHIHLEWHGQ